MQLANTHMWAENYGMRLDVPKYMLMMTDGKERETLEGNSLETLKLIKEKGVEVISVGIGEIDSTFITAYASRPEFVFNFTNYEAAKEKMADIAKALCPGIFYC